eukprot:6904204-Prymnesium_polylepis.1
MQERDWSVRRRTTEDACSSCSRCMEVARRRGGLGTRTQAAKLLSGQRHRDSAELQENARRAARRQLADRRRHVTDNPAKANPHAQSWTVDAIATKFATAVFQTATGMHNRVTSSIETRRQMPQ